MVYEEVPCPDGLAYYPFQLEAIRYGIRKRNVLIADEPGLGKTVEALGIINACPEIESVLVICPANLVLQWRDMAAEWLVGLFNIEAIVGRKFPTIKPDFLIVNYEKLIGAPGEKLREYLMGRKWDLLIMEEAHMCKNSTSQRAKAVLGTHILPKSRRTRTVVGDKVVDPPVDGLCQRADRILMMTGTPIMNDPVEIHSLVSILAPEEFGGFQFLLRYAGAHQVEISMRGGNKTVWKFDKPRNLEELAKNLRRRCMIRRLKEEVLPDLPAKTHQVIMVPSSGLTKVVAAEQKVFESLKLSAEDLAEVPPGKFKELSKARRDFAIRKIPLILSQAVGLVEGGVGKLIVFVHHKDVLNGLKSGLAEAGLKVATIAGGDSAQWVTMELDRFRADVTTQVMLCSMHAAAHGHNMTIAHHVLFGELDWNPAILQQCADRAHRIGQAHNVTIQYLVVEGSLEARMVRHLIRKQEIARKALG